MGNIKVNESPLGKNPRGIKGIDCSSHYVCGEFVVTANRLILLENVNDCIHCPQIFTDTVMGGRPCRKFSNIICTFHPQSMFVM
jgi:hypothetical protein